MLGLSIQYSYKAINTNVIKKKVRKNNNKMHSSRTREASEMIHI